MKWIDFPKYKHTLKTYRFAIVAFFIPTILYCAFLWKHILIMKDGALFAGHPYVWADWSMHIALAANFAFRPMSHWFDSLPVYSGARVTYPFVTNLLSGLLWRWGISLPASFLIPSFIVSIVTLIILFGVFNKILGSQKQAVLASYIYLLSGGLGFFMLLVTKGLSVLTDPTVISTQIEGTPIEVNTIVASMIVPQRAFLLGLPLGIFVMYQLFRHFILAKKIRKAMMILVGISAGLLPIIHTHTFLVVVFFSVWIFLWSYKKILDWLWYGIPSVVLSVLLYLIFLRQGISTSSFFSFHPGWIERSSISAWIVFWIMNWGLFLPLALVGTWLIRKKRKKMIFVSFFWILFAIGNLIQFQPQLWDNTKIFAWVYLGLTLPVVSILVYVWRSYSKVVKVLVVCVCLVLTISGGVDVIHNLAFEKKTFQMLSADQIQLGVYIRLHTDPTAVFLTRSIVSNPVAMVGGRSVLLGYSGWAFSYGLDYVTRESRISSGFSGTIPLQDLYTKEQVTHILVEPNDQDAQRLQNSAEVQKIFENKAGTIYHIK